MISININNKDDFNKKNTNCFFFIPDNQRALSSLLSSNLIIVTIKLTKNIIIEILEKNLGKIKTYFLYIVLIEFPSSPIKSNNLTAWAIQIISPNESRIET